MFIVSKDKKSITNLNHVATMYIGSDGCSIKADYENRNGCQLGRYNSEKEAIVVMNIIAENLGKKEVCFMPEDSSVKAKLNLEEQKWHHATGKKTKGHGGS